MGAEIVVVIDDEQADAQHREELALSLRSELLALEVDDVRQVDAGRAPPGTRAPDLAAVGELLVSVPASLQAIASLVNTVRAWLGRGSEGRTVELTLGDKSLKLGSASAEEQDRLVAEFLRSVQSAPDQ